jgi:hypothetical protein
MPRVRLSRHSLRCELAPLSEQICRTDGNCTWSYQPKLFVVLAERASDREGERVVNFSGSDAATCVREKRKSASSMT